MIYYEEGSPHKVFSPDVAVVKGVGTHPRRSYKLREEKQFPQVVFEISSRATWGEDLNKKMVSVSEIRRQGILYFRSRIRLSARTAHRVSFEKRRIETG